MNLDLDTIETTFDLVAPRGDELMDVFYARLFAAVPAVKPLFAGTDFPRQKTMLLSALVLVRRSLRDMDALVPELRELGARHGAYGATPEHYIVVGEVLIASLAEMESPGRRGGPSTNSPGGLRLRLSRTRSWAALATPRWISPRDHPYLCCDLPPPESGKRNARRAADAGRRCESAEALTVAIEDLRRG